MYLGRTQQAATDDTIVRPTGGDGLRRWENQRMLSNLEHKAPFTRYNLL